MKTIAYVLATIAAIAFVAPASAKTVIIKHGLDHPHHWDHHGGKTVIIKKHHHD